MLVLESEGEIGMEQQTARKLRLTTILDLVSYMNSTLLRTVE
jgi:hypothetical protein